MSVSARAFSERVRRRARAASRWLRALAAVLDDLAEASLDELRGAARRILARCSAARAARKRKAIGESRAGNAK